MGKEGFSKKERCSLLVIKNTCFRNQILQKCDALHDLIPFVQFKKREKPPWRNFTFNKVAGILQSSQENTCARASFLIRLQASSCFPVNFLKFLRTLFLQNTSGRLLLNVHEVLQLEEKSGLNQRGKRCFDKIDKKVTNWQKLTN